MTSSNAYYYTKVMSELFLQTPSDSGVSFQTIGSMADFWRVSAKTFWMLTFCVRWCSSFKYGSVTENC